MLRKLIQLGTETYVISLPSAWLRQHRLKKGDGLEVEEAGPRLVVYPASESRQGRAVVDVSGAGLMVKRVLGALYKAGYDEFEVGFQSPDELSSIKEVLSELVGFESVEEGKNRVLVRNVSHIIPEEFESLFRKMIFVIDTMAQEGLSNIKAKNWEKLDFTASMDFEVNKYADFCRRAINMAGHRVVKRAAPSYYLVEQLEKIGDSFRDICGYCAGNRLQLSKDVFSAYANVSDFFRQFRVVHGKFGIGAIACFAQRHYSLKAELESLLLKTAKKELPVLFLLKAAESDIFDMNGALMAEKL
ncbi:phosphate uptake regulator PhoU [Candidatus Woesearchaeota archaeon]|nr:phosphate uptake regulator PhoU [Candidatus Woesearchaeota archaeon]